MSLKGKKSNRITINSREFERQTFDIAVYYSFSLNLDEPPVTAHLEGRASEVDVA